MNSSLSVLSPVSGGGVHPLPYPQHPSTQEPVSLETAGRHLERLLSYDLGCTGLSLPPSPSPGVVAVSGLADSDYPCAQAAQAPHKVERVPLPPELVDHLGHMQVNCAMGLFPAMRRAWLTIDSDLYVWRYADGGDLAYFDGLSSTILGVWLLVPRAGILQPSIQHLLCLATPTEVVLLGVSISGQEMHLLPEPLFSLPCEGLQVRQGALASTAKGRLFMGGRAGGLYELVYQAETGWFGSKCRKVNHSCSSLGWLLPNFLGSFTEDPLVQLEVDDSRNILYTRSEGGTVCVWDLGKDGEGMFRVANISSSKLAEEAARVAHTVEGSSFRPLVHLQSISKAEDSQLHLVIITGGGARLYYATHTEQETRPNTLRLCHVRLAPGFAPSAPPQRPIKVHTGHHRRGLSLLASSPSEAQDVLWLLLGSLQGETHATIQVEGHTWALAEVSSESELESLCVSAMGGLWPQPAALQHLQQDRQLILLSAQGALLVSPGRPVDELRHLLKSVGNVEHTEVRQFFLGQALLQACATALALACDAEGSLCERGVQSLAVRALLLYGGSPKYLASQQAPLTHPSGYP